MNKYLQTPEHILDLHGMTCRESKTAIFRLLSDHRYSHVRIITGKGTFREKSGTLREFVKTILKDNGIDFRPSKLSDGGEGALEVFL
ncbi:MAG: Smr/MutS family protein [Candidatus Paceibacterota bacterium]|jgi:DNA-nicking Smr family endonuclease|nr:Smr/MutS family protein [Candidatus Paceibacterota bacterium]